ncbi:predicted protein [Scheffersomyces stipitis CBS 6054]|uniref:Uncharacterized protein n=1 Tax=Scheffersomyces stipitis (strain ATCC 58785 / CBS 6054 / NBRC 10063 / NRRL Y-11545) TaxID=322104 RepID=A3LVH1_PICST|nr:predicted protein [Scheffersomyces stipitis CBS 6054]ABN67122.2 predicted protein [Scheffersomyces stipitis CBS 6054]
MVKFYLFISILTMKFSGWLNFPLYEYLTPTFEEQLQFPFYADRSYVSNLVKYNSGIEMNYGDLIFYERTGSIQARNDTLVLYVEDIGDVAELSSEFAKYLGITPDIVKNSVPDNSPIRIRSQGRFSLNDGKLTLISDGVTVSSSATISEISGTPTTRQEAIEDFIQWVIFADYLFAGSIMRALSEQQHVLLLNKSVFQIPLSEIG